MYKIEYVLEDKDNEIAKILKEDQQAAVPGPGTEIEIDDAEYRVDTIKQIATQAYRVNVEALSVAEDEDDSEDEE